MFVDTLFVGVVKSIKKSITEQGTLLGILTFQDCSGELRIAIFEKDIYNLYKLDLDLPVGIILCLTNNPACMSPAPGYRYVAAKALFDS